MTLSQLYINIYIKRTLVFMKKKKNKALLIHSLELKIFLLELEQNLQKLNIKKIRLNNEM